MKDILAVLLFFISYQNYFVESKDSAKLLDDNLFTVLIKHILLCLCSITHLTANSFAAFALYDKILGKFE